MLRRTLKEPTHLVRPAEHHEVCRVTCLTQSAFPHPWLDEVRRNERQRRSGPRDVAAVWFGDNAKASRDDLRRLHNDVEALQTTCYFFQHLRRFLIAWTVRIEEAKLRGVLFHQVVEATPSGGS